MNTNYLPSKQFILKVITIVVLIAIAFGVYKISIYFKNKGGQGGQTQTKLLVRDLIQKDSNENGIADWEETLWGFNPNKNGPENKEAILAKKREIARKNELTNPNGQNEKITENDNLSREFFALAMSLQESGNLNETSMNSITDAMSSKINPVPIPDTFTKNDQVVKISSTKEDTVSYLKKIRTLFEKHSDTGEELIYLSQGVENRDSTALGLVNNVALSYRSLAKELISIPVPGKLAPAIFSMSNNYDKIGQSTEGLSKILDNPILAMNSLVNYKKYKDALIIDMDNLSKSI